MKEIRTEYLIDRRVIVLFVLQVAGWLLAVSALEHDPGPLVRWIQALPPAVRSVLSPLIVLAIPSIVLTVVVGTLLIAAFAAFFGITGFQPWPIDPVLRYPVFLVSAYLVAVLAVRTVESYRTGPDGR